MTIHWNFLGYLMHYHYFLRHWYYQCPDFSLHQKHCYVHYLRHYYP